MDILLVVVLVVVLVIPVHLVDPLVALAVVDHHFQQVLVQEVEQQQLLTLVEAAAVLRHKVVKDMVLPVVPVALVLLF